MIIDASKIREQITGTDLLITGEGKLDTQSSEGKVVGCISALARHYGIPVIALCGELQLDETGIKNLGLQKVIAIKDSFVSKEAAMKNAGKLLGKKVIEMLQSL